MTFNWALNRHGKTACDKCGRLAFNFLAFAAVRRVQAERPLRICELCVLEALGMVEYAVYRPEVQAMLADQTPDTRSWFKQFFGIA